MNLEQQAKNVAAQGRYGDSMIMHVNPAEVGISTSYASYDNCKP